ncbi:MAG: hypothetical protein FJ050_06680 [Cyanobacteria bacterium M_surface_7_m2_040]|nr:hypothetical protein [Cyanobacteria bacterium M_surface_7_m2_040]
MLAIELLNFLFKLEATLFDFAQLALPFQPLLLYPGPALTLKPLLLLTTLLLKPARLVIPTFSSLFIALLTFTLETVLIEVLHTWQGWINRLGNRQIWEVFRQWNSLIGA